MKKQKPKPFEKNYQKNWSEKHRYKHIHTGEYCTFESYVAEYLILRKIEAFNEQKPAYKFWTKGEKLYPAFIRQLKAALKLRKSFSEEIILGAIKSKHFDNIFYIGLYEKNYVGWKMNPLALNAIQRYHKEREELDKQKEISKQIDTIEIPTEKLEITRRKKAIQNKTGSLNRLRKL